MNLLVDNLHVSGHDDGSGPAALLLHGWGNDHRAMMPLVDSLAGRRVIAPDLPGFGGSQAPPAAWGVEGYAAFVAKLLAKLEVPELDLLIGHSFGGRIALVVAGEKLLPVKRLVLLSSHGLPETATLRSRGVRLLARTGRILPKRLRKTLGRRLASEDYKTATGVMREVFKKVIGQDATEQAKRVETKTLLIYGSRDEITPPEMGKRLQRLIDGSRLAIVEGAGHHLLLDDPERVSELIKGLK